MAHNDDKALYVDVENSVYLELYLDYKLWGSSTIYITFQPTIGVNIVRHFGYLRGVKVPNGFVSLKGEISGWEQYNIPIRIGIGAGIGGQGINFTYEPGDDDFKGEKRTTDTAADLPAYTFFIEVNFAISDAINLQGLFRRFSKSDPLEIPLDFSNPEFGKGTMGGYCITGGIEFDLNLSGIKYFMDF